MTYVNGFRDPSVYNFYKRRLKLGDVVIDVGANVGSHLFPMSTLVGVDGLVVGYEVDPEMANLLVRSSIANNFKNVIVRCAAISSKIGTLRLERNESNRGQTSVNCSSTQSGFIASSTTIDSEVAELQIRERVRLIKIDVEGHEEHVILGALSCLESNPDLAVVMEHFPDDSKGNEVVELMLRMGYKAHLLKEDGSPVISEGGFGHNVVWLRV
jgi:FkbM family methyltransferase